MISEHLLVERIEKDASYNFSDLIDAHKTCTPRDENEAKILNTIELYAFGGCGAYAREPRKYLELSSKSLQKLIELSVLSVAGANVGNTIGFSELLEALSPYVQDASTLESVLISLVDSEALDVKIHQEKSTLRIVDVSVLRDAYNEHTYGLRALTEDDLMVTSVGQAKRILQKWLDASIAPAAQELSGPDADA